MAKKAPNNSIGQFIEKSPIAKVFTIIAGTIAFTGSIIYWFVSNRYEVKIENLQNTLASIERRFSQEGGIDFSKLILQSVDDKSTSESNFFSQDNFFFAGRWLLEL